MNVPANCKSAVPLSVPSRGRGKSTAYLFPRRHANRPSGYRARRKSTTPAAVVRTTTRRGSRQSHSSEAADCRPAARAEGSPGFTANADAARHEIDRSAARAADRRASDKCVAGAFVNHGFAGSHSSTLK